MGLCEYDRDIMREIRYVLCEIRDVLNQMQALNENSLKMVVSNNNDYIAMQKELLMKHLDLLEGKEE